MNSEARAEERAEQLVEVIEDRTRQDEPALDADPEERGVERAGDHRIDDVLRHVGDERREERIQDRDHRVRCGPPGAHAPEQPEGAPRAGHDGAELLQPTFRLLVVRQRDQPTPRPSLNLPHGVKANGGLQRLGRKGTFGIP